MKGLFEQLVQRVLLQTVAVVVVAEVVGQRATYQ